MASSLFGVVHQSPTHTPSFLFFLFGHRKSVDAVMLSRYVRGYGRCTMLWSHRSQLVRVRRQARTGSMMSTQSSHSTMLHDREEVNAARQLHSELKVVESRDRVMKDAWEGLKLIGRGASVRKAQRKIGDWYYPVTQMLDKEKSLINDKVPGEDRMVSW